MTNLKVQNEKKVNKILKSLSKKEHLFTQNNQTISSQDTSFENKKLKEVLMELKLSALNNNC